MDLCRCQDVLKRDSNSVFREQHRIYELSDSTARKIVNEAPYSEGYGSDSTLKNCFRKLIREKEAIADTNFDAFKKRKPDPGYYLHAKLKGTEVEVEVRARFPFSLFAFPSKEGTRLYVLKGREWVGPEDVRFFRGKKALAYEKNSQAFRLPRDPYSVFRMEWKGKTFFFKCSYRNEFYAGESLDPDMPRYKWEEKLYTHSLTGPIIRAFRRVTVNLLKVLNVGGSTRFSRDNPDKTGYFALNKPRYKPGDTVKWKAYLLGPQGSPVEASQNLKLGKKNGEKGQLITPDIEPLRPGVYHGKFPIPDSLTLGQTYFLWIGDGQTGALVSKGFRYKDQSLDEESFKVELLGKEQKTWSPIKIRVVGRDAAGRPLNDALGRWTLEVNGIGPFRKGTKKALVPDTLYRKEKDWKGTDTLVIADSLLPPCDMNLRFSARMTGPSGRVHDTSFTFEVEKGIRSFKVRDRDSLIRVELWKNGQQVAGKGTLEKMPPLGPDKKDTVRFPFHWHPRGRYEQLLFRAGEARQKLAFEKFAWPEDSELPEYVAQFEPMVKPGERKRKDPEQVYLQNPRQLRVRYQLIAVENGREFYQGISSKDSVPIDIPSWEKGPFYLRYQFLWNGKEVKKGKKLSGDPVSHPAYKLIVNAPDTVEPGERVTVKIRTLKADGTPLPGVELTAWAFSSQFQGDMLHYELGDILSGSDWPDVPGSVESLERYYRSRDLECDRGPYKTEWPIKGRVRELLERKRMGLFYLHEPPNAYYERRIPIEGKEAQFSAFIAKKDRELEVPILVQVDEKALYYHKSGAPYTMRVSPGYHSVRIRTRDRAYRLDSVRFESGEKLELSLRVDKASEEVAIDTMPVTLTSQERADIRSSWIAIRKEEARIVIRQKDDAFFMPKGGRSGVVWAGPFRDDSAAILRMGPRNISFERFELRPFHAYRWNREGSLEKQSLKGLKVDHMDPGYDPWLDHPFHQPGWIFGTEADMSSWMRKMRGKSETYAEESISLSLSAMKDRTAFYGKGGLKVNLDQKGESVALLKLKRKADSSGQSFAILGQAFHLKHLEEGDYRAFLITPCDTQITPFQVKSNGTTYLSFEGSSCEKDTIEGQASIKGSYAEMEKEGLLSGQLFGREKGELLSYTKVLLFKNGQRIRKTRTDEDGYFRFEGLKKGGHSIRLSVLGEDPSLLLKPFKFPRKGGYHLKIPVRKEGRTLSRMGEPVDIKGMPARGAVNVRGARRNSTALHVGDIQLRDKGLDAGSSSEGKAFRTINAPGFGASTGGVPAQYGDITAKFSGRLRKKVDREYAYWVPDLRTDEQGKASFTVRFPGRIANWRNVVFGKRKKAITLEKRFGIHAIKPRELHLYLPRFLRTGDSLTFPARTADHTDTSIEAHTSIHLGDSTILDSRYQSDSSYQLEANIPVFSEPDTPKIKGVHRSKRKGFQDGVQEELPVRDHRLRQRDGKLFFLKGDTSLTISDSLGDGRYRSKIVGNSYRVLEDKLQNLKDYPHACNEQASSKLKGLLAMQQVQGKAFSDKGMIRRLIRKLRKAQNENGSWGWWPDGEGEPMMTLYVRGAMYKAQKMGYDVDAKLFDKSKEWILGQFDPLDPAAPMIKAVVPLVEQGVDVEEDSLLTRLERNELSGVDRIRYSVLASRDSTWKGIDRLLRESERTTVGGRYWKNKGQRNYRSTDLTATLLAYRAIRNQYPEHEALSEIRRYLIGTLRKGRSW
ncbi:MAG: alpha-2-macroglobulin family protein, partial [Flavobacteriales bacterium]